MGIEVSVIDRSFPLQSWIQVTTTLRTCYREKLYTTNISLRRRKRGQPSDMLVHRASVNSHQRSKTTNLPVPVHPLKHQQCDHTIRTILSTCRYTPRDMFSLQLSQERGHLLMALSHLSTPLSSAIQVCLIRPLLKRTRTKSCWHLLGQSGYQDVLSVPLPP